MNNFIIYSIEIAISLGLFYAVYWAFLKSETFFKLNRVYLISSVIISLLIPLLNVAIGEDSFITKNLILPIEQYEQNIIGNIDNKNVPIKNGINISENGENIKSKKDVSFNQVNGENLDLIQIAPLNSPERGNSYKQTNWLVILFVIYLIGAFLFLIRFMANFIWIFGYTVKYRQQRIFGMKVIRLEKNISPFSFLNLIFISHVEYPESELAKIISHEKVHIKQKHSIDLILFELLLVFQWFNPFIWFYKNAIKITHEYLADQGTLNSGIDLPSYQYSLLNQVFRQNNFDMASNYNQSIKKRITMMMKKRSTKLSALKLIIVLPILTFLFTAFAFKSNYSKKDAGHNERNKLIVNTDTSIKEVKVSIEYLKLLEGEYLSTNERNRVRKIKFKEAAGVLIGNDGGYIYRLIPVGGEKFINPVDGNSLVFNTQDINAITLLLFGKINLKKMKESTDFPKKSVAYSVLDIIAKNGITAALSYYKQVKDSSNYNLNENEMNFIGYQMLKSGKAKEASSIFKLNTEAFPNSFNVYDSYGEALMTLGEKTQAIENFEKSVQLNPGSRNGIKKLKESGINIDSLVPKVKVSMEYLKLLEGEYISTNQPNGIRKIKFTEVKGELIGNDNDYRYSLIPMGNGKFINPDDGASLVFDTKDKKAITLLLFGTINLKKI